MTATLAASTAILKVRYPEGRLPKSLFERCKFQATVSKREDWTGSTREIAIQNENPQGVSADFQTALGSLAQGTYNKFSVSKLEYFGIARIKGQALRAAEGNDGALVNLWKNETDGVSAEVMKDLEIFWFGAGDGIFGRAASGTTGATVTLGTLTDAAKFSLGMRCQAVSATGMSPTLRPGTQGGLTAIDRTAGTLTAAANWTTSIPTMGTTDYIIRAGNAATASPTVPAGIQAWIPGGTTPGTWYGLPRNTDPLRLAGQTYNATGIPMEEAIIEASSLVNQQGAPQPNMLWCHPRDLATFKKSLGAKVMYDKVKVNGTIAGVSFSGIEVDGDEGRITILTSPFIDRNKFHLLYMDSWKQDSLGPAPGLLNWDGNSELRVSNDDAYEARFGVYGNYENNLPFANITTSNWGA